MENPLRRSLGSRSPVWQLRQTYQSCHHQKLNQDWKQWPNWTFSDLLVKVPERKMVLRWWLGKLGPPNAWCCTFRVTTITVALWLRFQSGSNSGPRCQNCDSGKTIFDNGFQDLCHASTNSSPSAGCTGGSTGRTWSSTGHTGGWQGAAGAVTGESLLLPGSTVIRNFLNFCLGERILW